jgi:alpha-1,2-mannosyltransferase
MATSRETAAAHAPEVGVSPGRIATPRLVYGVIAVAAAAGALLRLYQLSRPGYLLGVTEYDDGVQFGDAVRLVSGVIPYRDFVVVQPPGSVLLMTPVALLAKVTGTAWGLGIARLLTAAADTACIVLLGLLVRHRGPLTAGIACGVYAVYPDALVAAHTFLLEPWLNLFCLLAALRVFEGDQISDKPRRLGWGGVLFGVAAAVKIWAVVPLAVMAVLVARRPRQLRALAAGAAAGFGVLVLPFLIMAPGGLIKDVVVSQFVRDNLSQPAPLSPLSRLSDMVGLSLFPGMPGSLRALIVLAVAAVVPLAYVTAALTVRRFPAPLDWYALIGVVAVTIMFLWPYNYWSHYGAFAGPFIALVLALPVGLLRPAGRPAQSGDRVVPLIAVGVIAAVVIAGVGLRQLAAETKLIALSTPAAAADKLIPAGSCVVTNDTSLTVSANRFTSDRAACSPMVDSWGTLLAMTNGQKLNASPQVLAKVTAVWRAAFSNAQYAWIQTGSKGQIPWTASLYTYFTSHFRLVGLVNGPGSRDAPQGGLYVRR